MPNTEAPASTAGKTQKPALVKVKITRKEGHRHAGVKHPEGAVISVSPADAAIIATTLKVGELVGGK